MLEWMNDPIFNAYDIILMVTFLEAIIISGFLFIKPADEVSHYFLPAFMIVVGAGQLCFLVTYNPVVSIGLGNILSQQFFSLIAFVFYWQGPLLYAYMHALTSGGYQFRWTDLLPLPVFLILLLTDPMSWFGELMEDLFWREHIFIGVVGFFINFIYGIFCLLHMRRYTDRLKDRFSTVEHLDFFWLRFLALGFLVIWGLEVIPPFVIASTWPWWLRETIVHAPGVIELLMLNFLVFSSLLYSRNIAAIGHSAHAMDELPDYSSNIEREAERIKQVMEAEQLYLTPGLTVEKLADHLAIPEKLVSQIVNRHFEMNFYEFVNSYRVGEAKRLLKTAELRDQPIHVIYEAAGFKSKSSFFTLFKKAVGITPSQYRDKFCES